MKWLIAVGLGLASVAAQANIVIENTRIVYPAGQKQISVKLINEGESPSLVQAWMDNGDEKADPRTIKLPFVVNPPVSRVDPKKQQMLRVSYTGEPLAEDRESLFFFNVLDIPPKPSKASLEKSPNYLQFSFRSRLKFFFRPEGLPYSVADAYNKVSWSLAGKEIRVNNPTPYFITYDTISVKQGNQRVRAKNADMVAPFSQQAFALSGAVTAGQVEWSVINDYGGITKGVSPLQ